MRENNFFFPEKALTNELFLVNIKHQFIALIREKPRHRNYCNFFLSNQKNKKLTVALFFFIFIFFKHRKENYLFIQITHNCEKYCNGGKIFERKIYNKTIKANCFIFLPTFLDKTFGINLENISFIWKNSCLKNKRAVL